MPNDLTLRLEIDADHYAKLVTDERFIRLLSLARCVNVLRFSASALPSQGDDTLSAIRARINSFFLSAAVLFEGMRVAEWLATHYRSHAAFADMASIIADRDVEELLSTTLKPLRDGFVFHFFPDSFRAQSDRHDEDEPVFAMRRGDQVYYQLADMIVVKSLIESPQSETELEERYKNLLSAVARLGVRFTNAADRLILPVLKEQGWQSRSG